MKNESIESRVIKLISLLILVFTTQVSIAAEEPSNKVKNADIIRLFIAIDNHFSAEKTVTDGLSNNFHGEMNIVDTVEAFSKALNSKSFLSKKRFLALKQFEHQCTFLRILLKNKTGDEGIIDMAAVRVAFSSAYQEYIESAANVKALYRRKIRKRK